MFKQMKNRSTEKELIDLGPSFYTQDEYADCLKKLFKINQLLGLFRQTVHSLARFPKDVSVLDIGCGGGLFLLHLSQHYPNMQLLGMDISATAIGLAQQELADWKNKHANIQVAFQLQQDTALALPRASVDIVLTTLVCHHMDDDALILFLQHAYQAARKAVIINDLHRHALAYWCYKIISPCLFRNRLITHDGLISIARSFTRADWHRLLKQANIRHYQIKWGFPFRWRVVLWKR
ncbi:MAG TPA: methyltransferase [Legionella sp.]|nr:methyltransferase [Legionella sp.]